MPGRENHRARQARAQARRDKAFRLVASVACPSSGSLMKVSNSQSLRIAISTFLSLADGLSEKTPYRGSPNSNPPRDFRFAQSFGEQSLHFLFFLRGGWRSPKY